MTVEDRIHASMAARVTSPPELPGLYAGVTARVAVLRRRRKAAAAVGTCLAVAIAVVVPLTLVGGGHQTSPSGPSPAPLSSFQTTPEHTPTTTSAPHKPALGFDVGAPPSLPVLLANGKRLSLQDRGSVYPLGPYGSSFEHAVENQRGLLLATSPGVALVDASHTLTILPGTQTFGAGCGSPFVTPDGRYLVLTRQDGPGQREDRIDTVAGEYGLYDLETRKLTDQIHAPKQGCPAAVLTDGRILMSTGDGAVSGAELWTPSSGLVTPVPSGTVRVAGPDNRSTAVRIVGADGQGCGFYRPGTVGTAGFLATCGPLGATGSDTRLNTTLQLRHLTVEDSVRLDHQHLEVLVSQGNEATHRWLLTCAVPVRTTLSCVQNQQFPSGTQPFLVH
jgi:hypothetical protein